MKKCLTLLVTIILILSSTPSALAAKEGSSCNVIGEVSADLVCIAKNKKKTWQKLDLTSSVQAVINLSLKSSKLPKNLTPALSDVRRNKSFWLDQECSVDFPDVKVPDCQAGDPAGKKIMVVYGDSHASMWMTALDSIAKNSGYRIYLFAKLACPLVEVSIWSYQLNRPFNECNEWQRMVLPKIRELQPDILVVTDQWKPAVVDGKKADAETTNVWDSEFPKALAKLNTYTQKLVVIGNNPSMQQDSVTCSSKPRANIALCISSRSQAGNGVINRIEEAAAREIGATYIDTVSLACNDYLCPIVIGNKFVYFDQWHFTETYVKWLTPVIKRAMKI